jgi:hypothetical protein
MRVESLSLPRLIMPQWTTAADATIKAHSDGFERILPLTTVELC